MLRHYMGPFNYYVRTRGGEGGRGGGPQKRTGGGGGGSCLVERSQRKFFSIDYLNNHN